STNPPTSIVATEAIAGDAALAEVQPYGEVTCVITNDDVPTTTAAPTTTTIAPTTTDAGGLPVTPTLPETGSSSSNTVMMVLALGLLTVGGSLMALRRR